MKSISLAMLIQLAAVAGTGASLVVGISRYVDGAVHVALEPYQTKLSASSEVHAIERRLDSISSDLRALRHECSPRGAK